MTNELAIRILTGDVLGTSEQTQEAITMAVRALSQPNIPDTNVGDIIYRQSAIDAMANRSDMSPHDRVIAVDTLVALPSVESAAKDTNVLNNDCIIRQAAIDALCDNCDNAQAVCPHYPCKQYTAIDALPSAQPEFNTALYSDGFVDGYKQGQRTE